MLGMPQTEAAQVISNMIGGVCNIGCLLLGTTAMSSRIIANPMKAAFTLTGIGIGLQLLIAGVQHVTNSRQQT
jgi:hypothetical protein